MVAIQGNPLKIGLRLRAKAKIKKALKAAERAAKDKKAKHLGYLIKQKERY